MPDDLYWNDTLERSERQSALLRRLAAGERVNGVDWGHVIEEIEDVGRSELRACSSLLRRAIEHLIKLGLAPRSESAPRWRRETRAFLADARSAFSPSMRQRLDLPDLYAQATDVVGDGARSAVPAACPFTHDELLSPRPELDVLVARLAHPAS